MFNKNKFRIMAKSKNGGSRAYIRGRIGSDVYSIGKNGKGEKQQVVRSLAETVANPRTAAQMANRMYMSTVMQAVSAMAVIIDHSFDGFPKGQPSISEFIRRNYALVKADALAHPASGNSFGLNKYQEKGVKKGAWVLASGSISAPAAVTVSGLGMKIDLSDAGLTVGGLKAALGLSADGYLTVCGIEASSNDFIYLRVKLDTTLADSTEISAANVASLFATEGNRLADITLATNKIEIVPGDTGLTQYALIVSELVDGAWKHNNAALNTPTDPDFTSDVALPTYPTGNEAFLNGGDI